MSLSDKQRSELFKDLRNALIASFVNDDHLEMMLQDELNSSLTIPTADDYTLRVFKLVKDAATEGKLRDLFIGASFAKPRNPNLIEFANRHFQSLLQLDPSSIPEEDDLLVTLLRVLVPVVDFAGIVWTACELTLPDIEVYNPNLRKKLNSDELSQYVKWLILLEIFLKKFDIDNEGQLYIILFVQNLACSATGSIQSELNQWLHNLPKNLQLTSVKPRLDLYSDRPSNEDLKTLSAYFLVTVERFETSDEYEINRYILTRLGNKDRYTKFEGFEDIRLDISDDNGEIPNSIIGYIKNAFPEWFVRAAEVMFKQAWNIKKCYELELPTLNITVEFWLPFEYLSADAEIWQIYGQPTRHRLLESTLGREYRVFVRSYDRFKDPIAFDKLSKSWKKILTLKNSSNPEKEIKEKYPPDFKSQWEDFQIEIQQGLLGSFLTCPICTKDYEQQRRELFTWMLEKGIPLVLWSRCVDLDENRKIKLQQRMQEWLTTADPNQLDEFFETIKQARAEACDNQCANQLALWCDEPERLEELWDFRESGRLSA